MNTLSISNCVVCSNSFDTGCEVEWKKSCIFSEPHNTCDSKFTQIVVECTKCRRIWKKCWNCEIYDKDIIDKIDKYIDIYAKLDYKNNICEKLSNVY